MRDDIVIDGSAGEGGGQVLRSSLTLSLITGRPFRLQRIRAGRKRPGLLRQHLTAVQAAAEIGGARVDGAALGASALRFEPTGLRGGAFSFAIGTAGSTMLILQTVLPALLRAPSVSTVTVTGGTHNPAAPPFEFIAEAYLPQVRRMGAHVSVALEKHGFYPAGGGCVTASVEPCDALQPIRLLETGERQVTARGLVAWLPEKIARTELAIVRHRLGLEREACRIETVDSSVSPGNVLTIAVRSAECTEIVTGFGERGVTAEAVAAAACAEAERFIAAGVPVGAHLADQLLIPMALAGGGAFRTVAPTAHTRTNIDVITRFLDVRIDAIEERPGVFRIEVDRGGRADAAPPVEEEVSHEYP